MSSISLKDVEWIKIKQKFNNEYIIDLEDAVSKEIDILKLSFKKGARIAITAGSRGIDRISVVLRAVVSKVKQLGEEP